MISLDFLKATYQGKPSKKFWGLALLLTLLTCWGLVSPDPFLIFLGAFAFTFLFSMMGHILLHLEGKKGGETLGIFSLIANIFYFGTFLLGISPHPAGLVGVNVYFLLLIQIVGWLLATLIGQKIWK